MVVSSFIIATLLSVQNFSTCIIFTLGQYIHNYYLQTYSNENSTNTTNLLDISIVNNNNNSIEIFDNAAQSYAQQRSADLLFWTNLCSCIPIIIMTYIFGLYTPKLGRQFVLLLPMFGTAIQFSIWLAIIYFHLPDYWWYIASFIVGLSGSDSVRNFVLNLFITENTVESERSSHFVFYGSISAIVSSIGTFAIGYYITWQGFNDLYWTGLILQLISIVIVLIFFKTNDNNHQYKIIINTDETSDKQFESFSFKNRSRKKSICLLLTILAYATYSFICTTFSVLILYFLNRPFYWKSHEIGNYTATSLISFGIFNILGMKILTKLGASDITICIISHIFFSISSLWIAYAQYNWQIYAGLLLSSFGAYQSLLTLSMVSKWLEPHERNHAFTLITEINTIMKVLGYCFYNWIYARTVIDYKNFTFLLAAALNIIPLVLNICLWFVSRWMSDEEDELSGEIDNESISLSVSSEWPPQIVDPNLFLVPQLLPNASRSNSIISIDFQMIDLHQNHNETSEV